MNIYILKKDLPDTSAGTRLYFENDGYSYKTIEGKITMLSKEDVENNNEFFRPATTTEFMYHAFEYKL